MFLSSVSIWKLEIIQRPSEYFRDSALLYACVSHGLRVHTHAPSARRRSDREMDEEHLHWIRGTPGKDDGGHGGAVVDHNKLSVTFIWLRIIPILMLCCVLHERRTLDGRVSSWCCLDAVGIVKQRISGARLYNAQYFIWCKPSLAFQQDAPRSDQLQHLREEPARLLWGEGGGVFYCLLAKAALQRMHIDSIYNMQQIWHTTAMQEDAIKARIDLNQHAVAWLCCIKSSHCKQAVT